MYFEGRELTSNAEAVSPGELEVGETYFALNYVDSEMLIPLIGTWVFIGRDLEPDDVDQVYFQDIESYNEGATYDWETEEWSVPINFVVAKIVKFDKLPVQLFAGARYWAASPDGVGPTGWGLRWGFTFLLPKG